MVIQWFPGHMTRAKREIEGKLKLIDCVIELLDARVPFSSRNPMIDEILRHKPRLVVLNKAELADRAVTEKWVAYFAGQGVSALPIDSISGYQTQQIVQKLKDLLHDKIEAQIRKGVVPRAIRTLIVGIPNVGKSTLINRLAGRKIAATGDRPGITKGQQWIKTGKDVELLDTPGILWPKFEDQEVGYKLSAVGSIKDEILQAQDIAFFTLKYLIVHYPVLLKERYGMTELPDQVDDPGTVLSVLEEIGRKRGCLQSGGRVDWEKAGMVIIRDLRTGKLGRVSLEAPQS